MSPHPWPPRGDEVYRAEAAEAVSAAAREAFTKVRLLVFDCDGVLTDGLLHIGPGGEMMKSFHAGDGLGLALARAGGLKLAMVTGRESEAAAQRAVELRFAAVRLGRYDKQPALREVLDELGVAPAEALYMGDDLIDIPALDYVGAPVTVAGAPADVRARCVHVTAAPGGRGAVREVCDRVLALQGRLGAALAKVAAKAWLPGEGNA